MVAFRPHFFILVEKDNCDKKFAFSYVPESVINASNYNINETKFREDGFSYKSLIGYIFLLFSKSYLIETWKLTDKFIRLKTKKINNWSFNDHLDKFNTYNVLSIVPIFKITDCIGYSLYHYNNSN